MLQTLVDIPAIQRAEREVRALLNSHSEWFFTEDGGAALSVNSGEFDFSIDHQRLIFSIWTERGSRAWRVTAWEWTGEKLQFAATRRMGAVRAKLEIVPRTSARAITTGIVVARQNRCEKLARVAAEALSGTKIERAALSPGMRRDQPGRYARIILRRLHERVAVTGTVAQSDARNVDSLFSSTLLWFARLRESPKRPSIQKLIMVLEHGIVEAARQRHVLLCDELRRAIELYEIDEEWIQMSVVRPLQRGGLWRKRLSRFPPVAENEAGRRAREVVAGAPQAIDVVTSRHGQNLRYFGLPFARVRRVMDRERLWFGIEGSRRRLLEEHTREDWEKLLRDLESYRNEKCRDRHHWLYRSAGEAWLESILRRDITKLDPGLIVAPLHAQFRTSHGSPTAARPIDLLALRHDGRLVVIELKVAEDREHVFQGVDYWRRVEAHRRRGHISSARLFGEREISDESTLVYLAAPALRFHPSFATLAKTIASDIEIYRFDINEDWRKGIRVVRRERVNPVKLRVQ